ncbi:MAG: hypothetical protein L3V56_14365 [Candidatus Magnetoovum sp. WYHC-5]|nr:hypothetical protein [Candidatus Magnetoovum sp. WYHC-5]
MSGENGNRIKSQHIFLFPFNIEYIDDDANKAKKHKAFINDIITDIKASDWQYKAYNPTETENNYNEFFYFHKYVQNVIFETKQLKDMEISQESAISYYFEKTNELKQYGEMVINIKTKNINDDTYKLQVSNISLRLFETGIGILSLVLLNYEKENIDDIMRINEFGRRIYPQFLDEKEGIDKTKCIFLANNIALTWNGRKMKEHFYVKHYNKML